MVPNADGLDRSLVLYATSHPTGLQPGTSAAQYIGGAEEPAYTRALQGFEKQQANTRYSRAGKAT